MSIQNESERLARAWIDGWNAGKPEDIPLAGDFTHASPFGVIRGRDEYLAKVKPMTAKKSLSQSRRSTTPLTCPTASVTAKEMRDA